jgi:NADH-quinone oxidoreductase subunit L
VDGFVRGLSTSIAASGRQMRRLQTGYVRNYALGIGIGAAALLFYVSLRAGS